MMTMPRRRSIWRGWRPLRRGGARVKKRCKHLLRSVEPNYRTTWYCKVLRTEVQLRELARFCGRCMYYEEVDGDENS